MAFKTHCSAWSRLVPWRWFALTLLLAAGTFAHAATNELRPWTDYRVIMWTADQATKNPAQWPLFLQRLREMGVNTGMLHHDGDAQRFTQNHFAYYVENIVNRGLCLKWNARVKDWDKFIRAWSGPRDEASMVREFCLDDPQWRAYARGEMQRVAAKQRAAEPLLYNIRDELSVTISANPFDYDFHPLALKSFREWLKTQYRDLPALNAEWDTQFKAWDAVRPFTTDEIKNRMGSNQALPAGKPNWHAVQRLRFSPASVRREPMRWNFSPWCDFRTYMDLSLARALDDLRQAAHAADPRTPVGVEGTQMPHAFGGYDLWRLSQVLDWAEPYDVANSREILGSFMPGRPLLATVFEKTTEPALRRLWHLLLLGDSGCIVWWSDDCLDWKNPALPLTPKAQALAPVFKELTSPLARIFLRAERLADPVLIHYSQPSIQVDWLLESTVDGPTWVRRFSSYEATHNRQAKVRNAWVKAFQDLGYSPRFISAAQIERGELARWTNAALVLPESLALSDQEVAACKKFLRPPSTQNTRLLFCDGSPGLFDAHGKLRPHGPLDDLIPDTGSADASFCVVPGQTPAPTKRGPIDDYLADRLRPQPQTDWLAWIAGQCALPREVTVKLAGSADPRATRVRVHRFRLGGARLLAFERNIDYRMSEDLKQAGGNEALEQPAELEAAWTDPAHVYDLRTGAYLGHSATLRFPLDPWRPTLLALLPERTSDPVAYLNK